MGIPGSNAMAILLGAFLLHGITPGPQIVKLHLDLVYIIVYVLFIAHVIGVFVAMGLSNFMEKLTRTRAEIISPIIIAFCLLGSYIMREYWQDMMVTTLFSIIGYYMRKHGYHPVPLLLGIILGPIAEFGYYQALSISLNGPLIFITRIPSLIILLCTLLVVFWPYVEKLYVRMRRGVAS
jgi:putative tricarboxylic transport membrane protein